jgi:hypothetical protein
MSSCVATAATFRWAFALLLISACSGTPTRPDAPAAPEGTSASGTGPILVRVTGLVRKTLELSRADLERREGVTARLNDVRADGTYRGVFVHRGVPLRTLLEEAGIEAKGRVFDKDLDLAVVVRGQGDERVVLSWGELFYRNPAEVLLAFRSEPLMPHKSCDKCHEPEVYRPWLDLLERTVPIPKLIVSHDGHGDRAIEGVTSVEVVDLGAGCGISVSKAERPSDIRAEAIEIHRDGAPVVTVSDLDGLPRREAAVAQAGDGTGFHGIRRFEGASLAAVLQRAGLTADPAQAFLLSARDGYRVLLAAGEVFLAPAGREILLADRRDGEPLTDAGRFTLVPVDDQSADRWLKAVARIDVLTAP